MDRSLADRLFPRWRWPGVRHQRHRARAPAGSGLPKLGERVNTPDRLNDKDAHDIYRLLVATKTPDLAETMQHLLADELSHVKATTQALRYLRLLLQPQDTLGATMAGRAEEGVGQPDTVSASVSFLAQDLLSELT